MYTGGRVPYGVTAHGSPSGPLQFDRLGSRPGRQMHARNCFQIIPDLEACQKRSNVIRFPSSPVLSCCVVRKYDVRKYDDCSATQLCFLLSEVQRVNSTDRSFGVVFARWWRLGILALARLAFRKGQHTEDSELILSGPGN